MLLGQMDVYTTNGAYLSRLPHVKQSRRGKTIPSASEARYSGELRKEEMKKTLVLLALALALVAAGVTAATAETPPASTETSSEPATVLDETCNSGHVCVWSLTNYREFKREDLCTGGLHTLAGPQYESAKNRCANKAVNLRHNGNFVACMNPGGNRPEPGGINEEWVFEEGSRC